MKRTVIAFAVAALGVWLTAVPASARDCDSCSAYYYYYDEYDYPTLGIGCCGPSERYTRRRHRDDSGYHRNRHDRASDIDDGNYRREGRRSSRRDRDDRGRDNDDDD